ncbi:hypothetical protein Tco_1162910 [Tanacetum coccineum]
MDEECLLEAKISKKEILKETMDAQRVLINRRSFVKGGHEDVVDEEKENDEDVLSTEDVLILDDKVKVLLSMSQAKAVSREKEKGVEFKDIEETDKPRPTSTRSRLNLKPLQREQTPIKNSTKKSNDDHLKHDERFISIGSAEDERLVKRRIEKGIDSSKDEMVKEESKEEESNNKRNLFNPDDEDKFWNSQQEENVVSWKLHGSSGVHTLMTEAGLVIHMLVEKKVRKPETLMEMRRSLRVGFSKPHNTWSSVHHAITDKELCYKEVGLVKNQTILVKLITSVDQADS